MPSLYLSSDQQWFAPSLVNSLLTSSDTVTTAHSFLFQSQRMESSQTLTWRMGCSTVSATQLGTNGNRFNPILSTSHRIADSSSGSYLWPDRDGWISVYLVDGRDWSRQASTRWGPCSGREAGCSVDRAANLT